MKVLHILGSLHRGGAETMVMNLYRAFDKNLCQMDFIVHAEFENDYRDEAKKLGAQIILLPRPGKIGLFKYVITLKSAIKKHGYYDVIHIHTNYQAFLGVIAAKILGCRNIFVHSHTTSFSKIFLLVNRSIFKICKVKRVACGIKAGISFFGKEKFFVINNAIDYRLFEPHKEQQKELKQQFGFKNKKIIGHIGSFTYPKNHKFILDIANILKKENKSVKILLFGEGPLEEEIKKEVENFKLEEYIEFMGTTSEAYKMYRMFDIFILPSLYEGFPVTLVESQVEEIPTIVSDRITKECDFEEGLLNYLPLEAEKWVRKIEEIINGENKKIKKNFLKRENYDISKQWKKLLKIYEGKNENSIFN